MQSTRWSFAGFRNSLTKARQKLFLTRRDRLSRILQHEQDILRAQWLRDLTFGVIDPMMINAMYWARVEMVNERLFQNSLRYPGAAFPDPINAQDLQESIFRQMTTGSRSPLALAKGA